MRFLLMMVFARIKKNFGQYVTVALQIALGSGIMYTALAMQLSAQAQFAALRQSVAGSTAAINGSYEDPAVYGENEVPPLISPEDYAAIAKSLPEPGAEVCYEEWFVIGGGAGGVETNIPVLLVSDNYFRYCVGLSAHDPARAYVGQNAAALLASHNFAVSQWSEGYWDAKDRSLLGVPVDALMPLSGNRYANTVQNSAMSRLTDSLTGEQAEWSYADAVIFPLSLASAYAGEGQATLYVPVSAENPAAADRVCGQITALMAERHPGALYSYSNPFKTVESSYNAQAFNARLMTVVSLVLFGILCFGFSGLLLLLVNKRKASLAISRMCGARLGRLAAELFAEVAVVVFAGAVAGMAVAAAALPLQSSFFIKAQNSVPALLLCLLGLLLVCALVSAVGIIKAGRAAPVRVLHAL